MTPLDYALGSCSGSKNESIFAELKHEFCLNTLVASKIFENIKDYSFLFSGTTLCKALTEAIRREVSNVDEFMESRFKDTKFDSSH